MKFKNIITISVVAFAVVSTIFASVSIAQTCDLTASPLTSFGPLDQGATSGDGIFTTLTNAGDMYITTLTITGADWQKVGDGVTIPVGQTKWATTDEKNYDTEMTELTVGGNSLGITPFGPSATQNVFFKVKIPTTQAAGDYTQIITFDFTCEVPE